MSLEHSQLMSKTVSLIMQLVIGLKNHLITIGLIPILSNLRVSTRATSTTLTITWTAFGDIDQFKVTYSYSVNRCSAPQGAPHTDTISDGSMRSHTLRDLNEDSSYTITVRAINTAGSTLETIAADTLTSGETEKYNFSFLTLFQN